MLLRKAPVGDASLLPLAVDELASIAIIGPYAARAQIMGGRSANLRHCRYGRRPRSPQCTIPERDTRR